MKSYNQIKEQIESKFDVELNEELSKVVIRTIDDIAERAIVSNYNASGSHYYSVHFFKSGAVHVYDHNTIAEAKLFIIQTL